MIINDWVHIPTWLSLIVIAVVLLTAIACSLWFPGEQGVPAARGGEGQPSPGHSVPDDVGASGL